MVGKIPGPLQRFVDGDALHWMVPSQWCAVLHRCVPRLHSESDSLALTSRQSSKTNSSTAASHVNFHCGARLWLHLVRGDVR